MPSASPSVNWAKYLLSGSALQPGPSGTSRCYRTQSQCGFAPAERASDSSAARRSPLRSFRTAPMQTVASASRVRPGVGRHRGCVSGLLCPPQRRRAHDPVGDVWISRGRRRRPTAPPRLRSSRHPAVQRPDTRGITKAGRDRASTRSPEIRQLRGTGSGSSRSLRGVTLSHPSRIPEARWSAQHAASLSVGGAACAFAAAARSRSPTARARPPGRTSGAVVLQRQGGSRRARRRSHR